MNEVGEEAEERFYDSLDDDTDERVCSWNPNPPFLIDLPLIIKDEYENNRSSTEIINQMFRNAAENSKKSSNNNKIVKKQRKNAPITPRSSKFDNWNKKIKSEKCLPTTPNDINVIISPRRSKSVTSKLKKNEKQPTNDLLYQEKKKIESEYDDEDDEKYSRNKNIKNKDYLSSFCSKSSLSEKSFDKFDKLLEYEFSSLEKCKNQEDTTESEEFSESNSNKYSGTSNEICIKQISPKYDHQSLKKKKNFGRSTQSSDDDSEEEEDELEEEEEDEGAKGHLMTHRSRSICRNHIQNNIQMCRRGSQVRKDSYLELYQYRSKFQNEGIKGTPRNEKIPQSFPTMESLDSDERRLYQTILKAPPSNFKPEKVVSSTGLAAISSSPMPPIPPRYSSLGPDIVEIRNKVSKAMLQKKYGQEVSDRNRQRIVKNKLNQMNKEPFPPPNEEKTNERSGSPPPFQPPLIINTPPKKKPVIKSVKKNVPSTPENETLSKIKLQVLQARNAEEVRMANEIRLSLANKLPKINNNFSTS